MREDGLAAHQRQHVRRHLGLHPVLWDLLGQFIFHVSTLDGLGQGVSVTLGRALDEHQANSICFLLITYHKKMVHISAMVAQLLPLRSSLLEYNEINVVIL